MSESSKITAVTKDVEELLLDTSVIAVPECMRRPILVRPKVLMGTGPTNLSQRVIEALGKPLMGLYHDETVQVGSSIGHNTARGLQMKTHCFSPPRSWTKFQKDFGICFKPRIQSHSALVDQVMLALRVHWSI